MQSKYQNHVKCDLQDAVELISSIQYSLVVVT